MSEAVERVAKAICNRHGRDYDRMLDANKAWWREAAVAAIEAMRRPTDAMLAAYNATCLFKTEAEERDHTETLRDAWVSMVHAALTEPTSSPALSPPTPPQ